jgi:hypothetical protein
LMLMDDVCFMSTICWQKIILFATRNLSVKHGTPFLASHIIKTLRTSLLFIARTYVPICAHRPSQMPFVSTPLPQSQEARCHHGDPPNDHALVHNSPHNRAMALKPLSISPPCATPVSASGTDDHHGCTIFRFRPPLTSSNSQWSQFTSGLNKTTSPCFRIIRGSISYVLVNKRWVFNVQSLIFSQIITNLLIKYHTTINFWVAN